MGHNPNKQTDPSLTRTQLGYRGLTFPNQIVIGQVCLESFHAIQPAMANPIKHDPTQYFNVSNWLMTNEKRGSTPSPPIKGGFGSGFLDVRRILFCYLNQLRP